MAESNEMMVAIILIVLSIISSCDNYDIYNNLYYPNGGYGNLFDQHPAISLPNIQKSYRKREKSTKFTGHYNKSLYTSYETNKNKNYLTKENDIAWETMTLRNGKRVSTFVNFNEKKKKDKSFRNKDIFSRNFKIPYGNARRKRRNVFGGDDRFYIPITKTFGLKEPYIYTVKLSTGCTGMLVSPRHVLTAAHCVHDQKDYITSTKDLKVGFFSDDDDIKWMGVKFIKLSKGWIEGGVENGPFFDYALLKLDKKHDRPFMYLSISEENYHGTGERISFAGFDDDKPENTLWHRTCNVVEDDKSFLYHYCDAKPGSSGSGVYSWVYDDNLNDWRQELVGVFSGNRWRTYDEFFIIARNFNVAVRLTSTKYAQICEWMGKTGREVCKYR